MFFSTMLTIKIETRTEDLKQKVRNPIRTSLSGSLFNPDRADYNLFPLYV